MITITEQTKIYILCPGNQHTGGPELLHQLTSCLIAMGHNAFIYYYIQTEDDPVDPQYKKYHVPYVEALEDEPQNIIILPETSMDAYYLFESDYANRFLLLNGVPEERILYLSDYLNPLFLQSRTMRRGSQAWGLKKRLFWRLRLRKTLLVYT